MKWGRTIAVLEEATFLLQFTVAVLELQMAMRSNKPPRWAARICRATSPDVQAALLAGSGPVWDQILRSLRGPTGDWAHCVYILYTKHTFYIGEATLERENCPAGMRARYVEHLRCAVQQRCRDGAKPRYRLSRHHVHQMRFLPCI